MQLNTLEIKGFKSFGDKVTVHFDAGVTGIVGPNGCGKSNIVDSIRWVLGEQKTKALRSDKMENIIFNGTKNRKPLQMAEVSLTFTNTKNILPTEYSQVSITRRLFRSGESEYLLNGVPCRLKDITNLFLDTGIGSDSYAIIELKMVDDILNDRENSRRNLFEEAAGVSKFKIRKKETLRKLEDTDKDLERVEDLLFEISKNLKSLEKQAKQAEQYFVIKGEYKEASIALARFLVYHQSERIASLNNLIQAALDQRSHFAAGLAQGEAQLEAQKAAILDQERLLASRQKTLNEHVGAIRNYESEKKLKDERMRYLSERSQSLQRSLGNDQQNLSHTRERIQALEAEMATSQAELDTWRQRVEALKQVADAEREQVSQAQAQVNEASQLFRQQQDQSYQAGKAVEIAEIQLRTLRQELDKTASDQNTQSESLGEFEARLATLSQEIEGQAALLAQLKAQEEATQARLESTDAEVNTLKDEINKLSRQADSQQNEYNLTKSLVDSLEGFPEAIRFLKKNSDWYANAPLLSDIVTCDERYKLAVETYLQDYMNYYVVDSDQQALQGIKLLGQSAKGRANFFILDRVAAPERRSQVQAANTVYALDILEYDSRFAPLMQALLQDVYIVDAPELPQDEQAVFIALGGHMTRRKHILSGGSVGLFEGKRIGRAKNLDKLQASVAKLTEEINAKKALLRQRQEEQTELKASVKKADIEQAQRRLSQLEQEQASVRAKGEQLAALLKTAGMRREDILKQIEDREAELAQARPAAEAGQAQLAQQEARLRELNQTLAAANERASKASQDYNAENIRFHQLENGLKLQAQDLGYKQGELTGLLKRIERNTAEARQTDEEIKALLEKATIKDDELLALYEEKSAIELGVTEAEKTYYSARNQIDQAEKELRDLARQRDANEQNIADLHQRLNEVKLELTSVTQRLIVEFELDLDREGMGDYEPRPEDNEDSLRQRVASIKAKLDRLGPINPMAMEAYTEMKERSDFITQQRQDLWNAKTSLLDTISEIDNVARTNFLETFNQIRANFQRVFRSLFTEEDTCDLVLVDPNSPLESPIDIVARPKGKRPLTINQLSGGEKTLTATSLLFAIYLIKPAPFCIFDEVDAPLDDANIDKFNNIIRTFSSESQFIIVTHNKRTMASTDTIYGVTMIEPGVSRVLPVDLRELTV